MSNRKKLICSYFYMDARLDFSDEDDCVVDEKLFLYAVIVALRKMFGETGASIPISILKYTEDRRAFLRFPARDAIKVHNALTTFSNYNGMNCAFTIFKMVPFLSSLSIERTV